MIQQDNNNEGTRALFEETFGGLMNNMGKTSISIKGLSQLMEKVSQSYKIVVSKKSDNAVIAQINAFFDQVEMIKEKTKDKNIQELMVEFEKAKIEFNGQVATGSYRKGAKNISNKHIFLVAGSFRHGPCPC